MCLTFRILRRIKRYKIRNVHRPSCKVPRHSRLILVKLEFLDRFWKKKKKIHTKFHENPSSGSRVVYADRETDRHDEADNCFSQFGERAKSNLHIKKSSARQRGFSAIRRIKSHLSSTSIY